MERKQDALRGVESPLIFMAYERGPTQALLASTPHVAKLSTIVRPVHGANVAVALKALAHAGAPQAPSSSFTTFQGFSGTEETPLANNQIA